MSAPVTNTVIGALFLFLRIFQKEALTLPSNLNLEYYDGHEAEQYSF